MINFVHTMNLIHSYSGNAKFVFTERTGVRLGGSEYA
jgi:hypothetical protein